MDTYFKDTLTNMLNKINISIKEEEIYQFYDYMKLLVEWNKKINLTTIVEPYDIILKHFVDSLTISKYLKAGKNIIDIGTGAGFPGIPLAIINTEKEFTLVDSLNKRINFLNVIKEEINLKNVNNIHSRAEDIGQNIIYREKFDIAVSRAVANLTVLAEYLIPTMKINGKMICMKANNIDEEIEEAKFAISKLGGRIAEVEKFMLPETDIKRTIIIIEKIKSTPNEYPRKSGLPSKQPLIK